MRQVDPRLALIRHALAPESGPARVSPLQGRKSLGQKIAAQVDELYPIADKCREDYEFEFEERVGIKAYSGMVERCGSKMVNPDCCAYHSTLLELGCVEFYDWQKRFPFDALLLVPILMPAPVGHCTRCESLGHEIECCPFSISDVDVMRVARVRRERRAGREVAA